MYNQYFDKVISILNKIKESQCDEIKQASNTLANTVEKGGIIHIFGTGHTQAQVMEIFYRAGGLVPVNAIFTPAFSVYPCAPLSTFAERQEGFAKVILDAETISENDCLIIVSTAGRNAVPIDMAIEAKKRGMTVIGLVSRKFCNEVSSRHSSGYKFTDVLDIVVDDHSEVGDAVMTIEGFESKVGATSSIASCTILQSMVTECVNTLVNKGINPPVWTSSNVDGGDEINQRYLQEYKSKVRCL
ncbi:sugar isomerase domain-containing protein [Photobacterium satsumensis]|uniref:sugar isomerase domain-containing protein n=1 Tax=Photobacterium satsumensis TaxID=2910239 RepID=UPI003D0CF922